jgi:dephospho-CoA kinase
MKRMLITGISGTGKSTVTAALAARGYPAIDADQPPFSHWGPVLSLPAEMGAPVEPDRDWLWQEDQIAAQLARQEGDLLFLSGCAANMGQFLAAFDVVVLLSAPASYLQARLATRTTNAYGKDPAEAARVLSQIDTVEHRLRAIATHEIVTTDSLDTVVARILQLAHGLKPGDGGARKP